MRFLDRSRIAAPPCLGTFNWRTQDWNDRSLSACRPQIRAALEQLQGRRCAYCEGNLDDLGEHIEHFCQRSARRDLTFDWNNLFLSCEKLDSCGKHKDTCGGHNAACRDHASTCQPYDCADLVHPATDDPDDYFAFRSDGTIKVRAKLSDPERHRAKETLRVFGLDAEHGRLRKMRRDAVRGYEAILDDLREAQIPPAEYAAYLHEELAHARDLPFQTTIRHVLTNVGE